MEYNSTTHSTTHSFKYSSLFTHTQTIHISYSGFDKDLAIIKELERSCSSGHYKLDYAIYEDRQRKEELIFKSLKEAYNLKIPIVVILSQEYFDLLWPTDHKKTLIKILTSHLERQCLFIWNVDKSVIRSYSYPLTATNSPNFRVITKDEYFQCEEEDRLSLVTRKLLNPGNNPLIAYDNFPIQEEIWKKPKSEKYFSLQPSYGKQYSATPCLSLPQGVSEMVISEKEPKAAKAIPSKTAVSPKKKKKDNRSHSVYDATGTNKKNFASYVAANPLSVVVRDNVVEPDGAVAGPSKSKKKKKKKDKESLEDDITEKLDVALRNVSEQFLHGVAQRLDGRVGTNWKNVAKSFGINETSVEQLGKRKGSPTEHMFSELQKYKPNLTVKNLLDICKKLECNEIIRYIQQEFKD